MAPECLSEEPYNMKADVYTFAVILWEIQTGGTPYGIVKGRSHLTRRIVEENVRPPIDEGWPSPIKGMLESSFDSEIDKRPVSIFSSSRMLCIATVMCPCSPTRLSLVIW